MGLEDSDTQLDGHESGTSAMEAPRHEHHQQVLNRLARIEGHVRAVRKMVEADTPCPDVLVQIAAVRSALSGVGRVILEDHLESCIVEAVEKDDYRQALRDLKLSLDRLIG